MTAVDGFRREIETGCEFSAPWLDAPARRALDAMRRDAVIAERLAVLAEKRVQTVNEPGSASPERRAEHRLLKAAAQRKKAVRKRGRR